MSSREAIIPSLLNRFKTWPTIPTLLTSRPIGRLAALPHQLSTTLPKQSTRQRLGSSGVWMARASEWQSLTAASPPLAISTGGFRRIRPTVHALSIARALFLAQRILRTYMDTERMWPESLPVQAGFPLG